MSRSRASFSKGWYKFSRNPLSVLGLIILFSVILTAIFAPYISPYPEHAGAFTNFRESGLPPSLTHFFGTDSVGRDIFSRVIFGYRFSLVLAVVVLSLAMPSGIILGLIAGYYRRRWIEIVIMRITDIFLAVPPLVLALAITVMLSPNLFNQMMAISLMWWPWYCRLVYSLTTSLRHEYFVREAELTGASKAHILLREILPNCVAPVLTKMTLDAGFVITVGASLSFIGLGVQPPRPGLGTMVADGAKRLPAEWWMAVFPALAIVIVILSFNLVGDGLRDMFAVEEV
ncbi:D-ala-D-ala transporter subunit [Candidatus Aerophobetes bacterium Ae_b3a]|nr:MAG: D-ala-D-ala transporter subunit [Candidatus Aerophobetes bacterium Ae_b3a]